MIKEIILLFFIFLSANAFADEVYLKKGDRISGVITSENAEAIFVKTEAMGEITVKKEYVDHVVKVSEDKPAKIVIEEPKPTWKREVSLGYNKTNGNTKNSQFSNNLLINRKTVDNEFTFKSSGFYSSNGHKMDAQKWAGLLRYAFSFWEGNWYNFCKLEYNHDRFANIDYRLTPSSGVGYWFSDTDEWKAMSEIGLGFEYTNYRDGTKDNTTPVLIPRAFLEKKICKDSRFSHDIILYPSLEDTSEYRLHSEMAFINPLSDKLSLKLSFVYDYNSAPPGDTKKSDNRFISSLAYSF